MYKVGLLSAAEDDTLLSPSVVLMLAAHSSAILKIYHEKNCENLGCFNSKKIYVCLSNDSVNKCKFS